MRWTRRRPEAADHRPKWSVLPRGRFDAVEIHASLAIELVDIDTRLVAG
jgi:hypothetical protein